MLKRVNLTSQQRLNRLFNYFDLKHGSATDMLLRMREDIGQRTFDEALSRKHFLSKLPEQV